MKKILIFIGIIVVLFGVFYAANSFIYNEKQAETVVYADGEYFGFIRALTDNGTAIDFDDAVWFTEETGAVDAALAAGDCTELEREYCAPNGFYIDNKVMATTRLPLSPTVEVAMVTSWHIQGSIDERFTPSERSIPTGEFMELINNPNLHWNNTPYTLTIVDGQVIKILEKYVPII
jgi:hypothetical protein